MAVINIPIVTGLDYRDYEYDWYKALAAYKGQSIILVSGDGRFTCFITVPNDSKNYFINHWTINSSRINCSIGGGNYDFEKFIERFKTKYPEHFELFLFHPEWID